MAKRFVGKVAVITGASEGVGAEVARLFVEEGAMVVLAARRRGPLEVLAEELEAEGGRALVVPTDVADLEACRRLLSRTVEVAGAFHVLVNNAGAHVRGPVADRTPAELATMVDVNAKAPIVLSRLALPHLKAAGGGAIVSVASLAGQVPLPDAATYSASKFALRVFSLALADELRDEPIRVSLVSPGPIIDTGFLMDSLDEAADVVFAQPMVNAREVATMVLDCAFDGRRERSRPRSSSFLARSTYVVPGLRRVLEPIMKARGRRMKAVYRARRDADSG
ncbi:MAG: SDR family NAD(P)-dependent oxidoreductase [Sandaracinaceae bacterium]